MTVAAGLRRLRGPFSVTPVDGRDDWFGSRAAPRNCRDRCRVNRDAWGCRWCLGGRGAADERDGHGVATDLGSFTFFIAIWVSMMAAMMLPGAAPAVVVFARASTSVRDVIWMTVIAIVVVSQKLLPAKAVIDVSLALAAIGLGILIVIAPTSIPGLVPAM